MAGWDARLALRVFAATLSVIAAVWLALWYFIPAPPLTLTIASGLKGGAYEHIAISYQKKLARAHVKLDIRYTEGGVADNLALVKDRRSGVDAAFLFGGYTNGEQSPQLASMGSIDYVPIWVFYRNSEPLDQLAQLKGKRIAVANAFHAMAIQILGANGVTPDNTTLLPILGAAAAKALKNGEVDVFFQPIDLNSPVIQSLLRDSTIRLMSLTQADALTRLFPNLARLVLPRGVVDLERNIPANDISLIATTNLVVVRDDVHPQLVYLFAQTLSEEHKGAGIFHRAGEFPTQTDTEFPMAEEASDFYKNGPSLLQRYLPFWMIIPAKRTVAIFVAAIAIVIPAFTYMPRLYTWFLNLRLARLYRRLRLVNVQLKKELAADQIAAIQTDLESIDRAANILPMRHSESFLNLLMHIRFARTELAARLSALRS